MLSLGASSGVMELSAELWLKPRGVHVKLFNTSPYLCITSAQ